MGVHFCSQEFNNKMKFASKCIATYRWCLLADDQVETLDKFTVGSAWPTRKLLLLLSATQFSLI